MKKKMHRIMSIMLAMVLSWFMIPNAVQAAEISSSEIKVEIRLTGDTPEEAEEFVVKMKAEDASYPMPEGSSDGEYALSMSGEDLAVLPGITYDKPGIYVYKIWQEKGAEADCIYDETVYELTIQVMNAENGEGLEIVMILMGDKTEEKQVELVFTNKYPEPTPTVTPEPTVIPGPTTTPKTGDESLVLVYGMLSGVAMVCMIVALKNDKKINSI